ncbi:signal peptidase I [Haloplanus rubicundus]|uniref:Signal peptidase I n=1 Tax=Haloplanus rubicundus TaxID=1547898 RepID=A0A345EER7_9EURY|nr:signal peptidase I [Haloplanus rubicundus]AXG10689.1 signal peptidase I [Haloplanus rubicundus]
MPSARRLLTLGLELFLVLVVVSLLAGQFLGQPVLLSYVETGSMAPTMEPGDGFVAVPSAVAGEVEEGDVITFRAEEIQGGGLTTHRVVGETERGYVTRGDANPFTDQDGGEPPVKEAQIVAKALQVGGTVVVIPNLGTVVVGVQDVISGAQRWIAATLGTRSLLGPQGLTYLLLAGSALAYVLDLVLGDDRSKGRERSRSRDDGVSTRLVMVALALLVVSTATAAMVVPAGTQEFGVVSAEFDSEQPTTIRQGESSTVPYAVPNAGLVPVHVYFDSSDGVAVDSEHVYVGSRGEGRVDLTLTAPPETGYYRYFLTEYRYLAVLPEPVVVALYRVHPWLPIVVIDALLGGTMYLVGMAVVGTGRVRSHSRDGPSTLRRLANRFG